MLAFEFSQFYSKAAVLQYCAGTDSLSFMFLIYRPRRNVLFLVRNLGRNLSHLVWRENEDGS